MKWPFARRAHLPSDTPRPLSTLAAGERGAIARVVSSDPGRLVKLSSLGLIPGVEITLLQRRPAVVVRVAETSIALDPAVAEDILVEAGGPPGGLLG